MLSAQQWVMSIWVPLVFVQSFVGTLFFSFPLLRKNRIYLRILLCGAGGLAITCVTYYCILGRARNTFLFILIFALIVLTVKICWKDSFRTALLVGANGYLAQHIAGNVRTILRTLPVVSYTPQSILGVLVLDALVYGAVYILLFFAFRSVFRRQAYPLSNELKVSFSLLSLFLCIGMSHLTKGVNRQQLPMFTDNIYSAIGGLLIFFIQYSAMDRVRLTQDVDTLKEIVHQQYTQYKNSRENVQLINEKYHDLKQMVGSLSGKISPHELEQLEQSISTYGTQLKTGNHVLDVLLTEKGMLCEKLNISVTSYTGGVDLSFVEDLDLYALFSNAFSNAIEAVRRLSASKDRFISLSISSSDQSIVIHMENPYAGKIELEDGLPKSTLDRRYHGFGMTSMQRIAEKYGGSLAVSHSGGLFLLDIILFDTRQ